MSDTAQLYERLKTLCELPGPAGDEGEVQAWLTTHWADRVQRIETTPMGNLIAPVGGQGKRLLIGAHADEICFIVKHIGQDGNIWMTSGQRDYDQRPSLRSPYFLPLGHPALIKTRDDLVEGLFATLTGHILTPYQRRKTDFEWHDVWVDIGAGSRAEVLERGVRVGDRVIWNPPTRRQGDFAYGKAMDCRVGLVIMDRLLDIVDRERLAYELVLVSTVQEELGLIGAESIVQQTGGDLAIALDVGLAGDVPGVDVRDNANRLGHGPVLVHKDSYAYNRPLTLALEQAGRVAGIRTQASIYSLYGSDAGAFQRQGVPAALLTVPTRFTHSPFEMVHLDDVEEAAQLLKIFVETGP